jgi:TetR/AcrR family transcriptional regulator
LEEQLSPILQALQLVKSNSSLSPTERLTFYVDQITRIHAQQPFLARLMINEVTHPTCYGGQIIESHFLQVFQFTCEALQEGISASNFRVDLNVTCAAISLAGILNFYFITKPFIKEITSLTEYTNAEYTANALQIYLCGITK